MVIILKVLNVLIKNNVECMGKSFWIDGNDGEFIFVYVVFNELDEVCFVSSKLCSWLNVGNVL